MRPNSWGRLHTEKRRSVLFFKMSREIFQTGSVDNQFEFYVSPTITVFVWIDNGICTAAITQSGSVYAMIQSFEVQEKDSIRAIAHGVAMELIVNYFNEDINQQLFKQEYS